MRTFTPICSRVFLVLVLAFVRTTEAQRSIDPSTVPSPTETPDDWHSLDRYQRTLTRAEFEKPLHGIFDPFDGLKPYLSISDQEAILFASPENHSTVDFRLTFAETTQSKQALSHAHRTPLEFRTQHKESDKPLTGLRVAIDPGHIGGVWGPVEGRSIYYKGYGLIQEGDFNLITARIVRDNLLSLGAEVLLTREDLQPVTPLRPADLETEAQSLLVLQAPSSPVPKSHVLGTDLRTPSKQRITLLAEFLFYRRHEILARGEKIRNFHPDITLVLYINATETSMKHEMTEANQNIFFVHGSYTKSELSEPHKRFRLLYKLMDDVSPIEVEVAQAISGEFKKTTKLPPVPYGDSSTTRVVVPDDLYVVARNLATNREYDGPVVVTEPYFMNNRTTARRLLMGDHEGTTVISGESYRSIFREYAEAVSYGLRAVYSHNDNPTGH